MKKGIIIFLLTVLVPVLAAAETESSTTTFERKSQSGDASLGEEYVKEKDTVVTREKEVAGSLDTDISDSTIADDPEARAQFDHDYQGWEESEAQVESQTRDELTELGEKKSKTQVEIESDAIED